MSIPGPGPTTAPTDPGRVINPAASMDAPTLRVGDLGTMSSYYARAFALEPIEEATRGREVHRVLGRAGVPMVRLVSTPDLPVSDPRQAGLFHTAFLFPDASALAATVHRAALDPRSRFVGSSDHAVSEAFYFTDPEGNGVELYTDRERSRWPRRDGQVEMTTTWLDPNAYLRDHLTQEAVDTPGASGVRVGHVHLQVGDLAAAEAFYVGALGFEVTQRDYPGALFVSAGGYHHHLAMNTWNSRGAGPRAASLGLGEVAITVPGREDLDALSARLRAARLPFEDSGTHIAVTDPWHTRLTVSLPGRSVEEVLDR
ncbi:VOC family protein [Actinomyces polynesiensis]|uniref:VOC family protein n=1 Tax=Actinomyces polynesiensis TaxID=1325934 RepID=UPI0005B7E88D|nr:VOC family protein [Actinomyces polynesiensis]